MPRSQTDFYARLRDRKELSSMVIGSMVRGKEMRGRFFTRVLGADLGGGMDCVASHPLLEKKKIKNKTMVNIMTGIKANTFDILQHKATSHPHS